MLMDIFALFCLGLENVINSVAHPLRIPGISVTSATGTLFSNFCSINTIKPMRASDLPMFLYGAET